MSRFIALTVLCPLLAATAGMRVESTISGSKKHDIAEVIDGSRETWFQGYRPPYRNDFVAVVLGKPQKLTSVRVLTGKPDGANRLEAGVLELSTDGRTYGHATPLANGEAAWSGNIGPVAAVRVRATADATAMLAVREIELEDAVLPKVVVTVPGDSPVGKLLVKCNFTQVPARLAVRLRDELDTVAQWFFTSYPQIVAMIDAPRDGLVRELEVRFKEDMKPGVPGYASGNVMTISIPFLLGNPGEVRGLYIHELTHVAQAYSGGERPGWLVEGIAEAVRYALSPPDDPWRAAVDAIDPATVDYRKAYRDTAPFLLWIEKQKPGAIAGLSRAMKDTTYAADTWKKLTGRSPDDWLQSFRTAHAGGGSGAAH